MDHIGRNSQGSDVHSFGIILHLHYRAYTYRNEIWIPNQNAFEHYPTILAVFIQIHR